MCGIAGSWLGGTEAEVAAMVAHLRHRGPDGSGVRRLESGILGHVRLAILDPAHGQQPHGDAQAAISYNGETYNFRHLAAEHLGGVHLTSSADTEVLFELYRRMGESMVWLLDGMYAFAIMERDRFFAARDPFGIKPLYYGEHRGAFHFASELKALAGVCDHPREFPPGTSFSSMNGWKTHFSLRERLVAFEGTRQEAETGIRAVVTEAVRKRLLSDVPLGVALSGGLDSSIVAACAKRYLEHPLSFAVGMAGASDLEAARLVAGHLGTEHRELVYTEKDMVAVLPEVVRTLESFDPALVRSAFPNWFLAQLASAEVKVMLTGEGADELYAGYDYLAGFRGADALQEELLRITESLHNTNLQRADRLSMAFGLEARVPFLDVASVRYAFSLPAGWKLHRRGQPKQLLRAAFADDLPEEIVNRPKLKFSQGAGSSTVFARLAEEEVSDRDFERERRRMQRVWGYELRTKEALFYYRYLRELLTDEAIFPLMGSSRSL